MAGHCRATFSAQTFSTRCTLKRPDLPEPIAHRLLACSGYRQIAREARGDPPNHPPFPVNLLDLLPRRNSANHRRETIDTPGIRNPRRHALRLAM